MSARRVSWAPIAVALAAVAATTVALAGAPVGLRAPLVLGFLLIGPGMAFTPLLGLGDPVAELTVALGVSIALDASVAIAMRYAGAWSPLAALVVLAALALSGAVLQQVTRGRQR